MSAAEKEVTTKAKMAAWYVRREGRVLGPFPTGQISQSILLGRISLTDEVSHDKENWQTIDTLPELVPKVMTVDSDDENAHERLEAAKRWADERRFERRQASRDSDSTDRRSAESFEAMEQRDQRESIYSGLRKRREFAFLQLLIVVILVATAVYFSFNFTPQLASTEPQCTAPAAPGINWAHCHKAGLQALNKDLAGAVLTSAKLNGANLSGSNLAGANLDYADLSLSRLRQVNFTDASLKGASLQNADLSRANLTNADLSYTDLTNAKLAGVRLTGSRLDNTIWVDGRKCLPGSIGKCRVAAK